MGQVVDLGEVAICQLKTGENRKRVNFRLRDTRYYFCISFRANGFDTILMSPTNFLCFADYQI